MQFVPSILQERLHDAQQDIARFGMLPDIDLMQLDIMDGTFVDRKSDFSAEEFLDVTSFTDIEVHLMVRYPLESLSDWLAHPNIVRVIVHAEVIGDHFAEMAEKVAAAHKKFGIAINPETSADIVDAFAAELDVMMCMGVRPGAQGQDFIPDVLEKCRALRAKYPSMPLAIDGGVRAENIVALKEAGVTRAVLGSYLTEGASPEKQLSVIRSLVS